MLATNLLVLLACKQYLAKPIVLIKFTSRTRALWSMPASRATNHLPRSSIRTTTTTASHQSTWITACGETRIIEESRLSQSAQHPPTYPPTTFGHTGAARERERSLSRVREPMGIEEGGGYTYTHAYIRACNSCHPRVAGCKQET